jgi:hypothetical protein
METANPSERSVSLYKLQAAVSLEQVNFNIAVVRYLNRELENVDITKLSQTVLFSVVKVGLRRKTGLAESVGGIKICAPLFSLQI